MSKMIFLTAKVYSNIPMAINMKGSSEKELLKVLESTIILMAILMKDILTVIKKTELVWKSTIMAKLLKAILNKIKKLMENMSI